MPQINYAEVIQRLIPQHERLYDGEPLLASKAQIRVVAIICSRLVGAKHDSRMRLLSALLGRIVASTSQITQGEAHAIIECAYPDMMPSKTRIIEIHTPFRAYIEEMTHVPER